MLLSDGEICLARARRELEIHPWNTGRLQPCSYDVTLGGGFRRFFSHQTIDMREPQSHTLLGEYEDHFTLDPGEFALGHTVEWVKLGPTVAGRLEGKSSIARMGLLIHVTGGFVDPGFEGNLTLELANLQPHKKIRLHIGQPIGQLSFMRMERAAERPYGHPELGSKYKGDQGAVESRMHENWNEQDSADATSLPPPIQDMD